MALGFIRKIFSFGRKEIDERPEAADPATATPSATPLAVPSEPGPARAVEVPPAAAPAPPAPVGDSIPEFLRRPVADAQTASRPVAAPAPREEVEAATAPTARADPRPSLEEQATPDEPATAQPVALAPAAAPAPPPPAPVADSIPEFLRRPVADARPAPRPVPLPTPRDEAEAVAAPTARSDPGPSREPQAPPLTPTQPPSPTPVAEVERTGGRVTVARSVETRVEASPPPATPAPVARTPWFQRLRDGLSRSSRELRDSISGIFTRRKLDEDTLQDLEDVLLRADLGMETAIRITGSLASGRFGRDVSDEEVRAVMAAEIEAVLAPVAIPLELDLSHKPHVILVVGVNGTGKTTTIGKLAAKLTEGGLSVMLAAGDTFRAAAIEQLRVWGERTGSPVVSSRIGADAAGLAFDAYEKAKAAGSDVLIVDTAGRLQNKAELMAELEKIVRVLGKHDAEAPHTVLQTVDATTGQNALNQVEIFRNVAGVNGLVMTKLDGTARGGILVAIAAKHRLPVYFIGVGEQIDDLEPFSAGDFARAIAGVN